MIQGRYIVQDRESGLFLGFEGGDIAPVRLIKQAVQFPSAESAAITAMQHCDSGYLVFAFLVEVVE